MRKTLLFMWLAVLSLWQPALAGVQEEAEGKKIFQTTCAICHTAQPGRNLIGPTLFGVVYRRAGTVPGFHYTDANRQSGIIWDPATLDRYLTAPREVVPGTAMSFPGLKDPAKRAEVIAFLETLR
jgi:cytochrome c